MNPHTTYGWFFRVPVRFAGQGLINAKYSLTSNGAIIKVKNAVHVKFIRDQLGKSPDQSEIIAPMEAVKVINGNIPDDYTYRFPASEYLHLRQLYQDV